MYAKEEAARLRDEGGLRRSVSERSRSIELLEYDKGHCAKCRSECGWGFPLGVGFPSGGGASLWGRGEWTLAVRHVCLLPWPLSLHLHSSSLLVPVTSPVPSLPAPLWTPSVSLNPYAPPPLYIKASFWFGS